MHHHVFGLFWLIGYQFSPHLRDIGKTRFWRTNKRARYGALNIVVTGLSLYLMCNWQKSSHIIVCCLVLYLSRGIFTTYGGQETINLSAGNLFASEAKTKAQSES
jgi:hypothetical protein